MTVCEQYDHLLITALQKQRNDLVIRMWAIMRHLSETQGVIDFTNEDLDIWTAVTKHSAIRERVSQIQKTKGDPS